MIILDFKTSLLIDPDLKKFDWVKYVVMATTPEEIRVITDTEWSGRHENLENLLLIESVEDHTMLLMKTTQ